MNYLASNAITGIFRDCFDNHFHIHLLMMQLPRQQSLSWRLNHRACSRGGIMRTCAILYFFFFPQPSSLTWPPTPRSPPAGEHLIQLQVNENFTRDMSWHLESSSLNIYLFDIGYDFKLKYNFTRTCMSIYISLGNFTWKIYIYHLWRTQKSNISTADDIYLNRHLVIYKFVYSLHEQWQSPRNTIDLSMLPGRDNRQGHQSINTNSFRIDRYASCGTISCKNLLFQPATSLKLYFGQLNCTFQCYFFSNHKIWF